MTLTLERAREALAYDPTTGVVTWQDTSERAGGENPMGYRAIGLDGQSFLEHRLVWFMTHGRWPQGEIDHINRVRNDNRIENLKEVTRRENIRNSRKRRSKTGYPGVTMRGSIEKPYVANISLQLGSFATAEEAAAAVREARRKLGVEL